MDEGPADQGEATVDFRVLFEGAPWAALVLDPELRVLAVSNGYLALAGVRRERLLGRSIFELLPSGPDGRRVQAGADLPAALAALGRRPGWSVTGSPVLGPGDQLRYILVGVEDERSTAGSHYSPEQTARLNLERDRTSELTQANAELVAEGAARNELLSGIGHELRTPLMEIGGFSELLVLEDGMGGEPLRWAGVIHRASQHLLQLVDDVLDVTGLHAGRLAMSVEPVLLSDVLRGALELTEPLAKREGIAVHSPEGLLPWVLADAQRLKQVIINLLVNAIRYNRPGGEVRLLVGAVGEERVRVEVVDTGAGIDPDSLPKLFVPFVRLAAEAKGISGSGLGLSLSRSLVEEMGGTIGASSAVGEGSTFWIELPRTQPPPDGLRSQLGVRVGVLGKREYPRRFRVLYIEDTLTNVSFVEAVLRRRPSIELWSVMMGHLGIELAREHQPHLILLDLYLPDISGDVVLAALEQDPSTREIPVVILSADATEQARAPSVRSGARACITKPIGVRALLEIVDRFAGVVDEDDLLPEPAVTLEAARLADLEVFDPAERGELVAGVIARTEALLREISEILAGGALAELTEAAHRGRNEALSVGARELDLAFARLETAANDGQPGSAQETVGRLQALWPPTREAIGRIAD